MIEVLRRNMMAQKSASLLPAEYQRVEYICNESKSFLKLGFMPNIKKNHKTYVKFRFNSTARGSHVLSHYTLVSQSTTYSIQTKWDTDDIISRVSKEGTEWTSIKAVPCDNLIHEATIESNNGVFYASIDNSKNKGKEAPILNPISKGMQAFYSGKENYALCDIFHIYYEEDDIKLYEYIPCYRKADNVAGMYDIVNNVFYTNAGTGKFTVGPDVIG